ncbi:META domain-containing protein [Colwellia sp. 20A7]|uniref:META domain-containing protein n=1 Tax=Colwellia sp. 20A7 TaxID=2689569 RepID=UPI00135AB013|nr:META domain-containing protein [Colwellia sp. 20A7]
MNKLVLSFILPFIIVLTGCQSSNHLESNEQVIIPSDVLVATNWTLAEINGVKAQNDSQDKNIILHANDNRVTGFAGCNHFFGSFEAEDLIDGLGKLKFHHIGSTKMACLNVEINEKTYFNALSDTVFYQLDESSLTLLNEALTVLAIFKNKK